MKIIICVLIGLIALFHVYVLWLEMFAWTTRAKKVFTSLPDHMFEPTKVLAANQGLYNGFLAAGLIWTFFITDTVWQTNIALFFLACVAIAGIYGGITASKRIIYVQALPAIITIILILI